AIGEYLSVKDSNMLYKIENDKRIFFVNKEVMVNESEISKFIDFYWRVYNDLSVPYTVYHAVAQQKPILTQDKGFLGEMIAEYNIGEVLDDSFNNLTEKI